MKIYTIKELKENKNNSLVIYIKNREEYNKLNEIFKLCGYKGSHCYSATDGTYSSGSSENNPSAYVGATIVKFNQIQLQENVLSNLIIW